MTDAPRRRRGRPAMKQDEPETTASVKQAETVNEAQEAAPKRRRRRRGPNQHGSALKLAAPKREGYVRRWVNDERNRIAELEEIGYTLVEETGIATHGPGTRVNRLAGTHDGGAPLKTYLMEIPEEFYREDLEDKDEALREFDQSINEGRDPTGEVDTRHSYRPGESRHSSISVER